MINRRELMRYMGLGAIAGSLPSITYARADTDVRLVLFILRGAVDGLALAPPYGESRYSGLRGELVIDQSGDDGMQKLDGMFGLHPSFKNTYRMYQDKEALVIHAAASPYRERSHFDGQDVLENGAAKVGSMRNGWLNRAIGPLGGSLGNEPAIALAQNTPLVLRGENTVTSWAPSQLPDAGEDTLRRIEALYANDEFFATRFTQALSSQDIAGDMSGMDGRRRNGELEQWKQLATSAAKFLTAADGPQIAVLEAGGWDTHANQGGGSGYLANRFSALDEAVLSLKNSLGSNWSQTVVAVVTEFGRTVQVNGTRGTDHGTASAALLLGGAVNGGQVISDWPGLGRSDLYEDRDLQPTIDLRSVFKSILTEHLLLADNFVEREVFPDSTAARPVDGLIRSQAYPPKV